MQRPTQTLLNRVKKQLGNVSDYRAAKELGVTPQAVSQWQSGRNLMGDEPALKAAAILGENPESILALLAADRATTDAAKKIWTTLARRLQRSTAAIALTALGIAALLDCQATHAADVLRQVCILCQLRRVGRILLRGNRNRPLGVTAFTAT